MTLLLLNRRTNRWQPMIPTQCCTKNSSCLDLQPSDFDDIESNWLVAGTFQMSQGYGLLSAMHAIPAFDGLHIIKQSRPKASWIFIACNGQPSLADPNMTTIDDIKQTLDAAADRLHFD